MTRPIWPDHDPTKQSIRSWSTLFEVQATACRLPISLWLSYFASLLKGVYQNAASMYLSLHPRASYAQLRDHLIDSLDRSADMSAELAFNTQERHAGEDLMVYASELNILAYTAYGQTEGCSRAMVDKLVLNVFK